MCAGWTFVGRQPRSTVPTEFRRGTDDQRPADRPPGRWGGVAKGAGQASKPDGVKYGRSPRVGVPQGCMSRKGGCPPRTGRVSQGERCLAWLNSVLTRSALLGLVLTPEAKSCSFWRTSLGKLRLLRPSGQREAGGGFLDGDREEVVTDPFFWMHLFCPLALLSLATLLHARCCAPWVCPLNRAGAGVASAHTPHSPEVSSATHCPVPVTAEPGR